MATAMSAVRTAKLPTVSRQPKLSISQASGAAERMLPGDETPTVTPASVPNTAGANRRAKMK